MTHHKRERKMECHYCGHVAHIPEKMRALWERVRVLRRNGVGEAGELLHGMFRRLGSGGLIATGAGNAKISSAH